MNDFIEKAYISNEPFLIRDAKSVEFVKNEWKISKEWTNSDGSINLDRVAELLSRGGAVASLDITDCSSVLHGEMQCKSVGVDEFVHNLRLDASPSEVQPWYLKNYHFCRAHQDWALYTVLEPLRDDWLDIYTKSKGVDDYRFVYLGAAGTWTPLHVDVYRSYSWSTNISGVKHWILYPPEQSKLFVSKSGCVKFDVTKERDIDIAGSIRITQLAGETLFVPSGWFHIVHNEGPTLSVNHNFVNGFNIIGMATYFSTCWKQVQESIADLRDTFDTEEEWITACDRIQKEHFGMSCVEYLEFLKFSVCEILVPGSDHMLGSCMESSTLECQNSSTVLHISIANMEKALNVLENNDTFGATFRTVTAQLLDELLKFSEIQMNPDVVKCGSTIPE